MQITLIAAMAKNRVIGKQGQLPWRLPGDLMHFKKVTLGKSVLMGYRTFLSLGKPLPHRRNLVLSRKKDLQLPGCEVFSTLESALTAIRSDEELMVIGGEVIFQQLLAQATKMILTFIDAKIDGDTFFPEWNPENWREISSQSFPADENNQYSFKIVEFLKINFKE